MKKYRNITAILLAATMLMSGCSNNSQQQETNINPETPTQQEIQTTTGEAVDLSVENIEIKLTEKDQDVSYSENEAVKIAFSGGNITVNGEGAVVNGSTVTITAAGTYILSGSGSGQVIVELADDSEKVQLVLDDLTLTNKNGAAVIVGNCDKTFITVPTGTASTLSDGKSYSQTYDESEVDAVIFAKSDVTINGAGSLQINGNMSHGIECKDDLRIYLTNITVESVDTAINGKDSLELFEATVNVNTGSDGLKADNDTDESKGFVYISDSNVTIKAGDKGIQVETFAIVDSGTISINSTDDGINSNNTVIINGGTININSSEDGIHGDYKVIVNGGEINVNASEGLEGTLVTVEDGTVSIKASDDGINASQKVPGVTPTITINGGTINIEMAQGDTDAIDANGDIMINGGNVNISAQFAFDYNGKAELNGGTVTVNGSQITQISNSMMEGPMGGQGQMPEGDMSQNNQQFPGGQQPNGNMGPGNKGGKRY